MGRACTLVDCDVDKGSQNQQEWLILKDIVIKPYISLFSSRLENKCSMARGVLELIGHASKKPVINYAMWQMRLLYETKTVWAFHSPLCVR